MFWNASKRVNFASKDMSIACAITDSVEVAWHLSWVGTAEVAVSGVAAGVNRETDELSGELTTWCFSANDFDGAAIGLESSVIADDFGEGILGGIDDKTGVGTEIARKRTLGSIGLNVARHIDVLESSSIVEVVRITTFRLFTGEVDTSCFNEKLSVNVTSDYVVWVSEEGCIRTGHSANIQVLSSFAELSASRNNSSTDSEKVFEVTASDIVQRTFHFNISGFDESTSGWITRDFHGISLNFIAVDSSVTNDIALLAVLNARECGIGGQVLEEDRWVTADGMLDGSSAADSVRGDWGNGIWVDCNIAKDTGGASGSLESWYKGRVVTSKSANVLDTII